MPRVTIHVPEKSPQPYRFELERNRVSIGRGGQNEIVVDCPSVSGRHAEMVRVPGGFELRDLSSTNGTKLNGRRMTVVSLRHGARAVLGDVEFEFELSDEERAALAEEEPLASGGAPPGLPPLPEAAAPRRAVVAAAPPVRPQLAGGGSSGGGDFAMVLVFLALAGAAFVGGLALRHQKETGQSLLDSMQGRGPAEEAPATPATE